MLSHPDSLVALATIRHQERQAENTRWLRANQAGPSHRVHLPVLAKVGRWVHAMAAGPDPSTHSNEGGRGSAASETMHGACIADSLNLRLGKARLS